MNKKPYTYAHPAALDEESLVKQCQMVRGRSSGPGGQHRNKVSTAVTYTHAPTGLSGNATESRQPERNRGSALFRLRVRLAIEHRVGVPLPGYEVSPLLRGRVKGRRLVLNPAHRDAPAILAEVLDVLESVRDDVRKASVILGLSSTQIVRFLAEFPEALAALNARRAQRGLHALR